MNTDANEQEALRLDPARRAELAQKLLLSLDALSEPEIKDAWLDEAERRARELDEGVVQPIPASEVRRKAQALLDRLGVRRFEFVPLWAIPVFLSESFPLNLGRNSISSAWR
jgi:hypothetical protein